ncbi:hypothetical protein MRX96_015432 [Rhipicephalus microplus]
MLSPRQRATSRAPWMLLLLVVLLLTGDRADGIEKIYKMKKVKKLAKLAILAKILKPHLIPIPFPVLVEKKQNGWDMMGGWPMGGGGGWAMGGGIYSKCFFEILQLSALWARATSRMVIIIVMKMEAAKEQAESIPEHPGKEATVLGVPVRRLQPVATVVFITVLGVASFFYFRPRPPREGKETIRTECYTSGCQELRLFLESTVNRSVDPCRDFFSFTCAAPLKQGKIMSDDVRAAVTAMVTAANVSGEGQSAFEKAVATYRACVSLYSQNRSEAEELGSFLTGLGLNVADPNSNHDPLDVIVQLNLAWNLAPIVANQ